MSPLPTHPQASLELTNGRGYAGLSHLVRRAVPTNAVQVDLVPSSEVLNSQKPFGVELAHVQAGPLIEAFADLAAQTDVCARGCTPGVGVPGWGLDEAVADGRTEQARVDSFRRLLASREKAAEDQPAQH